MLAINVKPNQQRGTLDMNDDFMNNDERENYEDICRKLEGMAELPPIAALIKLIEADVDRR